MLILPLYFTQNLTVYPVKQYIFLHGKYIRVLYQIDSVGSHVEEVSRRDVDALRIQ